MQYVSERELIELVEQARPFSSQGKLPNYIPALANAERSDLSIAICSNDVNYSAGDIEKTFTLQSVSKIFALALALSDLGVDRVFEKVGMEPTGDPFNSIAKLEHVKPIKPLNPMINAGALVVTDMIKCKNIEEKLERMITLVRQMANNPQIGYSAFVAESEFKTAFRNRALCYYLKEHGIIENDVEQLLDVYTKQCAIEVSCTDLARIGFVLANEGVDPEIGHVILPKEVTKIVTTFMVMCGMYNESGEFAIKVGIPAKSGVSGAVLSIVPGKMGISVYGPALNERGNSVAGIKLLESLAKKLQLNIFTPQLDTHPAIAITPCTFLNTEERR